MKKMLSLATLLVFAMSLMTGCGNWSTPADTADTANDGVTDNNAGVTDDNAITDAVDDGADREDLNGDGIVDSTDGIVGEENPGMPGGTVEDGTAVTEGNAVTNDTTTSR